MRIGRMIIDTDNMSIEEMDVLIREMRRIRARKLKAEELKNRMLELAGEKAGDKVDDFAETIKYSTIILTTVPVLCIYPFLQKYFVKGVMIGAVKG